MARIPKPYKKGDWWVTSAGGIQHQKLCRISEGLNAARTQLARLIVKQDEQPKQTKPNAIPTVGELHDAFLDMKEANASPDTYEFYRTNLVRFHEQFAERPVKSLVDEDATNFRNSLEGYANNTINARLQAVNGMFNWVVKNKTRKAKYQISENPFKEITRMPMTARERLLKNDEFNIIMSRMTRHGDRHVIEGTITTYEMFFILRGTTMRPQELRLLRWEYIQWDEHQVVFPLEKVKTRNRRAVTLLDSVSEMLKKRQERLQSYGHDCRTGYVFFNPAKSRESGKRRDGRVPTSEPISAASLSYKWYRAVKLCQRDGTILDTGSLVPYSFRHTRITELAREQHQFNFLMAEAGHESPKTTMRYVHLASSEVANQIREVDAQKRKTREKEINGPSE